MPIAFAVDDQQRRREAPDYVQLRCRIEAYARAPAYPDECSLSREAAARAGGRS